MRDVKRLWERRIAEGARIARQLDDAAEKRGQPRRFTPPSSASPSR